MYVWLNLRTTKFYLIKLATDGYWQPSYLLDERASLQIEIHKETMLGLKNNYQVPRSLELI